MAKASKKRKARKATGVKSGGAKLKAAGKRAILLGVTPDQYAQLQQAAALEMRPVTQFVTFYAVAAAQRKNFRTPQPNGDPQ